jgi:membrane-bound serine protease (ClpP class)
LLVKLWSFVMEELLTNPDFAYLVLVGSVLLASLALINPGTGILELLALVGLILAGVEIYFNEINPWALVLLVFGVFPFLLAVRRSQKMRYLVVAIASFVLGSAFLFKGEGLQPAVNPFLALIVSVLSSGFMWIVISKSVEASMAPPVQDLGRLIGKMGETKTDVHKEGSVQVEGELWSARSKQPIPMGAQIRVLSRDGFILDVEQVEET